MRDSLYFNITKQNVATSDPSNPLGFSIATGEPQSQGVEFDLSIYSSANGFRRVLIANYRRLKSQI
ncbi:hypothetical protein QUB70_13120 [Microcoleus sp. A003_D6]|uniref:hypothetical protein n=1 Tax=Microcoleus sp. A003_D6 TaxID=3055266 RepID=UPI002FD2344C